MFIIKFITVFILSFLTASLNAQTNYYISENGNNNNDGLTELTPFLTINKGVLEVQAGGTVYVMNGTYRNISFNEDKELGVNPANLENSEVVNINKSGTVNNEITIRNLEGHTPIIEFDGVGGIKLSSGVSYIIIEGFEVVGASQFISYDQAMSNRADKVAAGTDPDDEITYNKKYFDGNGIFGFGEHSHIIVRNNIVHDTPGSGIRFNDSDYMIIEDNTVYNATWWTTSASSGIVFAETNPLPATDNGTDIKMIMRRNTVYNNWNRIPFYKTQLPDNSGNTNPDYGTAEYTNILDGQGLYVTRSDDNYNGTFLFENNLCVNNGKNGINFDNSLSASAIFQNNTLYYNGVHDIIQANSFEEGNIWHGGQKVGGIKANKVFSANAVNNIIVTRNNTDSDSIVSAIEFNNIYVYDDNFENIIGDGVYSAIDNLFLNGKLKNPDGVTNEFDTNNLVNIDPAFVNAPSIVDGAIDMSQTNFELMTNSPAINTGNPNYSPVTDIDGVPRPTNITDAISYSSFENSTDGWTQFGATVALSSEEASTGNQSLFTSERNFNYSSPRLFLDGLLTIGETYTFYVNVKLADGGTGTSEITIKNTLGDEVTYSNLTENGPKIVNNQNWTQLSGDFTYTGSDQIFVYIKGPTLADGAGSFYIDDFSLVPQDSDPVNFNQLSNILDMGAYEIVESSWTGTINSNWDNEENWSNGKPLSTLDATIIDVINAPIISGNTGIKINNLIISEPDGLTINSGSSLIVNGMSSGRINYKRNIPTTNWYLVSAPVEGQTIVDFYTDESPALGSGTGNAQNVAIAPYDNAQASGTDRWNYYTEGQVDGEDGDDTSDTFATGTGYAIKMQASGDVVFTGTLRTNDVGVSLSDGSGSGGNAFNFIGNPYTSYISVSELLNENSGGLLSENTIWLWDQSANAGAGGYVPKNLAADLEIAPGQGFFVLTGSAGTFDITEAMQSHSADTFFTPSSNRPEINLTLTNESETRAADIYYIDGTTTGFDNGYDSSIFGGFENEFAIYTHEVTTDSGRNLGIQSLPDNDYENMIIPVGINATSGMTISISASSVNLPAGIKLYLQDTSDNSFTLLENDSKFTTTLTSDLNGSGRFYLYTALDTLGIDSTTLNDMIGIYTPTPEQLRIVGVQSGAASVVLYNTLGKQVLKTAFQGQGANNIALPTLASGVYVIKLTTESGIINRKIILNEQARKMINKSVFVIMIILINIDTSISQTLCINQNADQKLGIKDGYRYELWNQNSQGTACMSIDDGALFSGYWNNIENYLARRGLGYNQTKNHEDIGDFHASYACNYNPSKTNTGNSYLAVYGWTVNPLIEYYIIEDWRNWIASMSDDVIKKGSIKTNGSVYDIYEKIRHNKPSIIGTSTFKQYFSIRRNKRNSGNINISKHFNAWQKLGMDMGLMHEVSFVVEGYKNKGDFKFTHLDIKVN